MAEPVPDEVERLLTDAPVVAHLATCRNGDPHVAPLWFRYVGTPGDAGDGSPDAGEEGSTDRAERADRGRRPGGSPVVEVMTTGRKLANLRANPRVALSVQHDVDGHPEWRVVLRGTATVVEDEAATRAANRAINLKYGADDPDAWLGENTLVRIAVGSASVETF